MILNVITVSVVGGILCLDRVVLQVMISRPIVAAPLIGLILGDLYTGLVAGAFIINIPGTVSIFCAIFLAATTIIGFFRDI